MKEEKQRDPVVYWVWTLNAIAIIVLVIIAATNWQKVKNYISPDKTEVVQVENSGSIVEQLKAPTIEDILLERKLMIESCRKDSVFLSMPEVALIAVLMKIGTEASIEAVVNEYELSRNLYNKVVLGADIQKNIIQPAIGKDSVPLINK